MSKFRKPIFTTNLDPYDAVVPKRPQTTQSKQRKHHSNFQKIKIPPLKLKTSEFWYPQNKTKDEISPTSLFEINGFVLPILSMKTNSKENHKKLQKSRPFSSAQITSPARKSMERIWKASLQSNKSYFRMKNRIDSEGCLMEK
ncbi:unnamed protein product [Blepharisma stoltei]|uniref:Uncharacterized protein n=1 Tax=Blepharisma stoltei TaxID=1481888 RepID=A0AAU9JLN8_9CILI|nr:unnamed protein product [Blepharisma stoltei]